MRAKRGPEAPLGLELELLEGLYAVCRLDPTEAIPAWALGVSAPEPDGTAVIFAIVRSERELSIVCSQASVPAAVERSGGWRGLRVAGRLDHALTGVLLSLAAPLAEAGVPIFAVSSYDTDYLLVPDASHEQALAGLRAAGHRLT